MAALTLYLITPNDVPWNEHKASLRLPPGARMVGSTDDINEALQAVVALKPDVVFMASRLHDAPALPRVADLRRLRPSLRIFVVAAELEDDECQVSAGLGAAGYLLRSDLDAPALEQCLIREMNPDLFVVSRVGLLLSPGALVAARTSAILLTPDERLVLTRIDEGFSHAEIEATDQIPVRTVERIVARLYDKLGVEERDGYHLAKRAMQLGLIH